MVGCTGMTGPKEKMEKQYPTGTVLTFKGYDRFPTGCLQHPVFERVRPDKFATECVFDFDKGIGIEEGLEIEMST